MSVGKIEGFGNCIIGCRGVGSPASKGSNVDGCLSLGMFSSSDHQISSWHVMEGGIAKDPSKRYATHILHGNRTSTKRVVYLTHLSWRCQSSHGRRHYPRFPRIELGSNRSCHSFGGHTCTSRRRQLWPACRRPPQSSRRHHLCGCWWGRRSDSSTSQRGRRRCRSWPR